MQRTDYWLAKQTEFSAIKSRMNITFQLGDKTTRDRVEKPLKAINKELSTCREAIRSFQ